MHSYDDPVYIISVVCDELGIHAQTLRFYEREKLVVPKRTAGGKRMYSQKDLDMIRAVRHLTREKKVNIAGVKIILEMRVEIDRLKEAAGEI